MAINKSRGLEGLDDLFKCGIVEKNVNNERVQFLKRITGYNKFTVVVVPSPPPPKAAPSPVVKRERTCSPGCTSCRFPETHGWCNQLYIQSLSMQFFWKIVTRRRGHHCYRALLAAEGITKPLMQRIPIMWEMRFFKIYAYIVCHT